VIRLIQCLCPHRHCVAAVAYDDQTDISGEVARRALKKFIEKHLNAFCGICQSRELQYEDQATIFKTMEEAKPHLAAAQELNLRARKILKARSN